MNTAATARASSEKVADKTSKKSQSEARGKDSFAQASPQSQSCACGGGCPKCQKINTPLISATPDGVSTALPESVRETLSSPGHPIDASTHRVMQGNFSQLGVAKQPLQKETPLVTGQKIAISQSDDASERQARQLASTVPAVGSQEPEAPPNEVPDFSHIRLHTDANAARSAQALRANAYTFGRHVVMGANRYAPGTPSGNRLLTHELTHTMQHNTLPTIQRDGTGEPSQGSVTMTVSLDGLHFEFPGFAMQQGLSRPQVMAMIMRRLLGEQYTPGIEIEIIAELEKKSTNFSGHASASSKVEAGVTPHGLDIDLYTTFVLMQALQKKGLTNTLTDQQKDLLMNAAFINLAWQEVKDSFPSWYTEWIFRREMAQRGALLAAYRSAKETGSGNDEVLAINELESVLVNDANLLDRIRQDLTLVSEIKKPTNDILEKHNREGCSVAYAMLFNLTLSPELALTTAPETVSQTKAVDFLRFMRTQPKLMVDANVDGNDGHDARVKLLGRFGRFWVRSRSGGGDEKILKKPALANTPPWAAKLSSTPQVMPPLFEAALETDHAFTMSLQFAHFTDAFASYSYSFEFIKVPKQKPGATAPDISQAAGEKPSFGKVMNTRLARTERYNTADLESIHEKLGGLPFGESAKDLVEANNALRTIGTVIHTVLDKVTEPRYVTRYVFPSDGMYIVRCRALPVLDGEEEVVRLPSVAYLPIVARNPDEMAIGQVKDATRIQFDARLRIAEIQTMFQSPFPPENVEALRQEVKDLQAMLLQPQEALDRRKADLDSQIAKVETRIRVRNEIAAIEAKPEANHDKFKLRSLHEELAQAGGDSGNNFDDSRLVSRLKDQRDSASNTITMHSARTKDERGLRFTPNVSFVSDLGHSLQLSIEMYDRGEGDGVYQVYMSDITTPDSGEMLGTAPLSAANPRLEAIKNGLKKLLETSSDYGRGRIAIQINGQIHVIQIQAGTGRMLTEAVENATMVASLAAIVAAPFTAGSSLYLLLPLGAIGAIPSAYRLYERYDENRLRLDFAAVMDVVNLVGGVLGLAQAATPLRAVRLGKVLMVMGIGADGAGILLMGAGLAVQLDALNALPEHERAAKMLEILGGAMLQIGIQAGGAVMHARYQSRRTGAATDISLQKSTIDEPGFHALPKDETVGTPPSKATPPPTGDRSMAGSGGPVSEGKLPTPKVSPAAATPSTATTAPKTSPEHLFDKLANGIDRSLPPPPSKENVKTPAKAGEFQRNLRTADAAYDAYNRALAVSAGREVAIYHNAETGEFRIMIGNETGVRAPSDFSWNAVLHYHPNENNALTFRLPAPQDFKSLMMRYVSEGVMVREFIEFDIPGVGRGRTEYGIDPGNAEPFYVRIHQPDGSSRTLRFAHDGHYSAYWGDRTIVVPKDSPVYDAMIRDIESYLRSIGADKRGDFGPPAESPAAVTKPSASNDSAAPVVKPSNSGDTTGVETKPKDGSSGTTGKSVAGSTTATPARAMQTGTGDLTDAGIAFIRKRFEKMRDNNGKSVSISTLSDLQIREHFPNQSSWLEAVVVGEARTDWLGRSSKTDFLMSNPTQNFEQVAARLSKAVTAGNTGHSVHDAMLSWTVKDFVGEMLAQKDPGLTAAYNACENNTDPGFRRRWNEFKNSGTQGDMSGFFWGTVGKKRPDLVEVMLSQNAIHITDASFAYQDPIHNFKSAFYKSVVERLINVGTVTSTDYRAPLRQTPM
jgi:hypothetical protein